MKTQSKRISDVIKAELEMVWRVKQSGEQTTFIQALSIYQKTSDARERILVTWIFQHSDV